MSIMVKKKPTSFESNEQAKKKEEECRIRNIKDVEPADYFPKELRKKYKLGEYADN